MDNNARTQAGTVSVFGLNFGQSNNTPSSRLDTNECTTVAWTSASAVNCHNTNSPTIHSGEVTVGTFVGTRYAQFSFDGSRPTLCVAFDVVWRVVWVVLVNLCIGTKHGCLTH